MTKPFIFHDPDSLQEAVAKLMVQVLSELFQGGTQEPLLALSGGSTPLGLFSRLVKDHADLSFWSKVQVLWVDERHVPYDHSESNYGNAKPFLDKLGIPRNHIHPMGGDMDTESAAKDYDSLVREFAAKRPPTSPLVDLTLLGMGPDGHVASLFPGSDHLQDKVFCKAAIKPETDQPRISLTLPALNNTGCCIFMATGASKAEMVKTVLKQGPDPSYPASMIQPFPPPIWFLDKDAAAFL